MDEALDLLPRYRRQVKQILAQHAPGVTVWAYGSRVKGESHPGSDLDLVLRGPGLQPLPFETLRALAAAFHDSTIPIFVEARDWARLPPTFHEEIEGRYVVLTAGSAGP